MPTCKLTVQRVRKHLQKSVDALYEIYETSEGPAQEILAEAVNVLADFVYFGVYDETKGDTNVQKHSDAV